MYVIESNFRTENLRIPAERNCLPAIGSVRTVFVYRGNEFSWLPSCSRRAHRLDSVSNRRQLFFKELFIISLHYASSNGVVLSSELQVVRALHVVASRIGREDGGMSLLSFSECFWWVYHTYDSFSTPKYNFAFKAIFIYLFLHLHCHLQRHRRRRSLR